MGDPGGVSATLEQEADPLRDRWPPTNPRLPDLSSLDHKNALAIMLNAVIGRQGITAHPGRPFLVSLTRLTDKSILAYQRAAAALEEWNSTPLNHLSPFVHATDHMEDLVVSLHRAFLFAERLRRDRMVPPIDKSRLPTAVHRERLRKLRDAITHTDKLLAKGEISSDEPFMLMVLNDGLTLGGVKVTYEELAGWLRALHDLVKELNAHVEPERNAAAG